MPDRRQAALPEALAGGFADSIPLQLFVPRMVQGIHSPPLGHIATMLKDLDTVSTSPRHMSPVPMSALAAQLFRLAEISAWRGCRCARNHKLSADKTG
jgi:3-hydroxyisobutyrate dehydrogenase